MGSFCCCFVAVSVAAFDVACVACFLLGAAVSFAAAAVDATALLQAAPALVVHVVSEVNCPAFGERVGLSFTVSSSPLSGQRRGPF